MVDTLLVSAYTFFYGALEYHIFGSNIKTIDTY